MQINDRINGFLITSRREVPSLHGVMWEGVHEKSGAQLAWLDNKEENKLFSVAFRTLPWDDTGVFHIMEHSVLAGSKRYPVKEPFLDLLKSSMNTFLNAMTFSDKTVYPVSSRNTQDFLNLTAVYLDAVFCPAVYDNPNIFRQEGWHYELRSPNDAPVYKGVVFNEMKGAFSNIDSLADYGITRLLFPDSPYRFVSGGDPAKIPDLTYARFLDAHRHFYHPSNARIYLDGDVPFDAVTRFMDAEYLSRYDKQTDLPPFPVQTPVPAREATEAYAVGEGEDTSNRTCIVLGKLLCGWEDRLTQTAAQVLANYLTDNNASPLKRALLSAGLCQDVDLYVSDGVFQPYLVLLLRNTEARHKEALRNVIRETVQKLIENGPDAEDLEAELNRLEFSLRETDEPKGLMRNLNALTSWLYGGDPLDGILFEDLIQTLREKIGTGYYEKLLADMLLDEEHLCTLTLEPSNTKAAEDAAAENARLAAAALRFSDEDRIRLAAENADLDRWQNTPDSPAATATLPVLTLKDVSAAPQWTPTEEKEENGVRFLYHPVRSDGVVHVRAYFEINDVPAKDLPAVSFLTDLLGELPTKRHDAACLQRKIKKRIGAHDFRVQAYNAAGDPAHCRVMFIAAFSALEKSLPEAERLVAEILTETDFSDKRKIKEIVLQTEDDVYQSLLTRGSTFAIRRSAAACSAAGAVHEQTDGLHFYGFIKKFAAEFDGRIAEYTAFAQKTCAETFTKSRLILGETATAFVPLSDFTETLPPGGAHGPAFSAVRPAAQAEKEAVTIPAGVSYAASVANIRPFGASPNGTLHVLCRILTYSYLWNEIRVKGGAYGCGCRDADSGNVTFYSYRDPSPANSLAVFAAAADFIKDFVSSEETTDKYIIGAIASDEPLSGPGECGAEADGLFFSGMTYADKVRLRKEMLALKKEDLPGFVPLFCALAESAAVCAVGNADALEKTDLIKTEI
ncbi:MAG: insulinase family protein [Clostridia bacterium]|nr:insulinase family protein [Clostridia bacterium]